MSAVASSAGAISATAPGGKPVSSGFSDGFGRANGPAGQPWYTPDCSRLPLVIVSNTLQTPTNANHELGLLLDSDDFDLTFDVHYAAANGNFDDVQIYFRTSACWTDTDAYLLATNPDTSTGGTHGGTLYRRQSGTFTVVHFEDHGDILENTTYTYRLNVHGTTFDWYVNGALYYSTTMPSAGSGRAMRFLVDKAGTYIDNVSLA